MKKISVPAYQCEFCDEIFQREWECEFHEKEKHKCPNCKHVYYVYGCERECELKKCKFERKMK